MIGFVILRNVYNEISNKYWKECYNSIRKYYSNNTIMIIDDNSDEKYLNNDNITLTNVIIIESEYKKGGGEILYFYYYYKYKCFDKAIFINDTTFIEKYIDFENINEDIKYFWNFNNDDITEYSLINKLNNKEELIKLYKEKNKWKGCYECMMIIKYDFMKKIINKYNLLELVNHIEEKSYNKSLEKIIGVICQNEKDDYFYKNNSIFTSIHNYNKTFKIKSDYSYDEYEIDKNNSKKFLKIIKIFKK